MNQAHLQVSFLLLLIESFPNKNTNKHFVWFFPQFSPFSCLILLHAHHNDQSKGSLECIWSKEALNFKIELKWEWFKSRHLRRNLLHPISLLTNLDDFEISQNQLWSNDLYSPLVSNMRLISLWWLMSILIWHQPWTKEVTSLLGIKRQTAWQTLMLNEDDNFCSIGWSCLSLIMTSTTVNINRETYNLQTIYTEQFLCQ